MRSGGSRSTLPLKPRIPPAALSPLPHHCRLPQLILPQLSSEEASLLLALHVAALLRDAAPATSPSPPPLLLPPQPQPRPRLSPSAAAALSALLSAAPAGAPLAVSAPAPSPALVTSHSLSPASPALFDGLEPRLGESPSGPATPGVVAALARGLVGGWLQGEGGGEMALAAAAARGGGAEAGMAGLELGWLEASSQKRSIRRFFFHGAIWVGEPRGTIPL